MQSDSAAGLPAAPSDNTTAPRAFTWRDLLTGLVILPVVILAIVTAIVYVRTEAPQSPEITLSEYRFVLKLARTQPTLRPAIANASKAGKINRKDFDAILDRIIIRPGVPPLPHPRSTFKPI